MVNKNLNILMIAAFPPPLTGQSVATNLLYKHLIKSHRVKVINLSKDSYSPGINSLGRIFSIFYLFLRILKNCNNADVIYITIAQSYFGVLRDIFFLSLCIGKLNKVILHSHGNGIKFVVYDKSNFLRSLSSFFFHRIHGLIILGKSSEKIFEGLIEYNKLHVVKNFAANDLFISEDCLIDKHLKVGVINILFLSNFISGKGYLELMEAFLLLPAEFKKCIQINFAGAFENSNEKEQFLNVIKIHDELKYLGIINGEEKRLILHNSHIFCLPTYYQYEGQPISILEAYASGCAVVTTNHAGILDIFEDGRNGLLVDIKSSFSLVNAIQFLLTNNFDRMSYALNNFRDAQKFYKEDRFFQEIEILFKSVN
jgi:glycosyltransferase involved in cell wall biosynthesis